MMRIASSQMWVHDQDAALAFYTEKLGMEVRQDVTMPEMGNFRWLTVGPKDQPEVAIVLMAVPGAPVLDDATADQIRELMGKGFAGTLFLTTDDCRKSYDELVARGVTFSEPLRCLFCKVRIAVTAGEMQLIEDEHVRDVRYR